MWRKNCLPKHEQTYTMNAQDWIVGIGSPHGNDAVGWLAIDLLRPVVPVNVQVKALAETTQLISILPNCRRLWLIDAAQFGGEVGEIQRWNWADWRDDGRPALRSTHGLGLAETLTLAEKLNVLPATTVVYAVEIGASPRPGESLSPAITPSLALLARLVLAETQQPINASAAPARMETE